LSKISNKKLFISKYKKPLMQEKTIQVRYSGNYLDISTYMHRGKTDKWLFCLHGLQTGKNLFTKLLQRSALSGYSYVSMDFVGFGSSSKPEDFSYDLRDQAEICKEVISNLDLSNIYIIGHSMGGMVGTMLLGMLPEKITGLINLEGNLVEQDCGESKKVAATNLEDYRKTGFAALKRKLQESTAPSAEMRRNCVAKISAHAFYHSSRSIVAYSESGELLPLFLEAPQRKLYIFGDSNRFKTEALEGRIQLAEVPNSGHFMFQDNFLATAKEIEKFLQYH